MQIDSLLTPLRLSYLLLHRQLESLARWTLDQSDPLPALKQHQAQLDAYQASLWDQLLRVLKQDSTPMAYMGLVEQQLGLRRCGQELIELGELFTAQKVLKPARKQLRDIFSPLQHLFHLLNQGLEKQTSVFEIEQALKHLHPPLNKLKNLLDKRFKSGQHASLMLHQYEILWQLQRIEGPLSLLIEGIMTWQLGSPQRLEALHLLRKLAEHGQLPIQLTPIAHTQSGALIHASEDTIIKQGPHSKLADERKNLKVWQKRWPKLVPDVIDFHRAGEHASLIMGKAEGHTLEYWLIQPDLHTFQAGLQQLLDTLSTLWKTPACKHKCNAHFMQQLQRRLPDILRAHPEFNRPAIHISGHPIPDLKTLIERAAKLEQHLTPVCAAPIHGDLNLDNILYDPHTQRITFVDLNRAGKGDYAQDLTTLMVSLFRIPNYHPAVRARINWGMKTTLAFAREIGPTMADKTIDAHLAFGLARGFLTSTRFVFEPWHARQLFERGDLLLQQLTRLKPKQLKHFTLEESLFHAKGAS